MSYASNRNLDIVEVTHLAVIKPRTRVTNWVLVGGTIYKAATIYDYVSKIVVNGSGLTKASSSSVSTNQYYFEQTTKTIYIDIGVVPDVSKYVIATFEMFFGESPMYFNRIPTDSASDVVFFEALLKKMPSKRLSLSDSVFGFFPSQSTAIELVASSGEVLPFLNSASFNNAEVSLYQCLGVINNSNFALIHSSIARGVSVSDESLSIELVDKTSVLDGQFQGAYNDSSCSSENDVGKLIPYVYGRVEGIRGIFHGPAGGNPTSAMVMRNRSIELAKLNNLWTERGSEPKSHTNTSTRTHVPTYTVTVGDFVSLTDLTLGSHTRQAIVKVTAIGAEGNGAQYVEHASITAFPSFSYIQTSCIARVELIQDGKLYEGSAVSIWPIIYTSDTVAVTINAGTATTLGAPRAITNDDTISFRVYGMNTIPSHPVSGPLIPFNAGYDCLSNPVAIIYDILANRLLVDPNDIDGAQFETLAADFQDEYLGFSIPAESSNQFPTVKEIITQILATSLLKLTLNAVGKWTIAKVQPVTSTTRTIGSEDILENSFSYNMNYDEIASEIIVKYGFREVSDDPNDPTPKEKTSVYTNPAARYLHEIDKQKEFKSLHMNSTQADRLARRLSYIFGERTGKISVKAGRSQIDSQVGDTSQVQRLKMPGFAYDAVTVWPQNGVVSELEQQESTVQLTIDDQKGIQDNLSNW